MTDVDREMLRHLRAYRAATRPSDGQRDGALQGLLQRVRAGDELDMDLAAPRPVLAAASRMRWVIAAASVAALLGGGALLVAAPTGVEPSQPSSSAALYGGDVDQVTYEVVEVAPTPAPAPKRSPPPRSPVTDREAPAPTAFVPIPEPPARNTVPRPKPAPAIAIEPSIDAAEVAALRRAQAELASAPADALARIVEHTKTYPSSSLAAERDAARATALCNLGRVDEARAAVAAFEERRPGSPLLPRIRRICSDSIASRDGSTGRPH